MNTCNLINTDRLFKEVIPNLGNPANIILELLQNAQRSGATKVDITLDENNILTCINNGAILKDFAPLLTIADTDFSSEVTEGQHPAGLGIMLMMAHSTEVEFMSGNSYMDVNCKEFFNDSEYREHILEETHTSSKHKDGMQTILYLNKDIKLFFTQDMHHFTSLQVTWNGVEVPHYNYEWLFSKEGTGELEGMTIGIMRNKYNNLDPRVFWYGNPINIPVSGTIEKFLYSAIVHDTNHLFKPRFPDRDALVNTQAGLLYIKGSIAEQLQEELQTYLDMKLIQANAYISSENDFIVSHCGATLDSSKWLYWNTVHKRELPKTVLVDTTIAGILKYTDTEDTEYDLEDYNVELDSEIIISSPVLKKGLTEAPAWYLNAILTHTPVLTITTTPKHAKLALLSTDYDIDYVESIDFEGHSIDSVLQDSYSIIATPNADASLLAENMANYSEDSYTTIADELWHDYEKLANAFKETFDMATMIYALKSYLATTQQVNEKIDAVSFNLENNTAIVNNSYTVTLKDIYGR